MPRLTIRSVEAAMVRLHLNDRITGAARKPRGVAGAAIFGFVADEDHPSPPNDLSKWMFMGSTTRTRTDVRFDGGLPPGTKVCLAACWFNPRTQRGPVCQPRQTHIAFGGPAMFASMMQANDGIAA